MPRFGGLFSRLGDAGQWYNVVPMKAVHTSVPSQHLIQKVLHLVCEFRVSIPTTTRTRIPAFAGMTDELPRRPRSQNLRSRRKFLNLVDKIIQGRVFKPALLYCVLFALLYVVKICVAGAK